MKNCEMSKQFPVFCVLSLLFGTDSFAQAQNSPSIFPTKDLTESTIPPLVTVGELIKALMLGGVYDFKGWPKWDGCLLCFPITSP